MYAVFAYRSNLKFITISDYIYKRSILYVISSYNGHNNYYSNIISADNSLVYVCMCLCVCVCVCVCLSVCLCVTTVRVCSA